MSRYRAIEVGGEELHALLRAVDRHLPPSVPDLLDAQVPGLAQPPPSPLALRSCEANEDLP